MKIVCLAASSNVNGINNQLLRYASKLISEQLCPHAEIEFIDLNDYEMPLYTDQRNAEGGPPAQAKQLLEIFAKADRLLLSFAEHNGCYTAVFKNCIDWLSIVDGHLYQHTTTAMFAASPGKRAAKSVLDLAVKSAPFFKAHLVGNLGIGNFYEVFQDGRIIDENLNKSFTDILRSLIETEYPEPE